MPTPADREERRRILPLLKGSGATMGARALSDACRELEQGAGTDPSEMVRELARLADLAGDTTSALRARLLSADSPVAIT